MDTQVITVNNEEITIPFYYEQIEPSPDMPEGSDVYMTQTENAVCYMVVFAADENGALPRDKDALINVVRSCLDDNQGIIKVEAQEDYVYSIIKRLLEPSGVEYVWVYQKFYPEFVLTIQGFFREGDTTGIRDNTVFAMLRGKGLIGSEEDPFDGWCQDPYDADITEGALMNASEEEEFDEMFPDFPLSLCRELIRTVIA